MLALTPLLWVEHQQARRHMTWDCSESHKLGEQDFTQPSTKTWEPQQASLRGLSSAPNRTGNLFGLPSRVLLLNPWDFYGPSLRSPEDSGSKVGFSFPKWVSGTTLGPICRQTSSGVDPEVLWLDRDVEEFLPFPLRLRFEVFPHICLARLSQLSQRQSASQAAYGKPVSNNTFLFIIPKGMVMTQKASQTYS